MLNLHIIYREGGKNKDINVFEDTSAPLRHIYVYEERNILVRKVIEANYVRSKMSNENNNIEVIELCFALSLLDYLDPNTMSVTLVSIFVVFVCMCHTFTMKVIFMTII